MAEENEIALVYASVVPSLSHISDSVAEGGRKAATVFSDAFRLESTKSLTTASGSISAALGTAMKPHMDRVGRESGKAYGTGLAQGIRASQAEVTASLAALDTAFKANRQSILDVTAAEQQLTVARRGGAAGEQATAAETALLAARRESEQRLEALKQAELVHAKAVEEDGKAAATTTGHFGRLGTTLASLKTHFASTGAELGFESTLKDIGGAAKDAGGMLKNAGESAVGMATKLAGAALSPLGLGVALAGVSAIAIEVTRHLVELGDTYEGIERIFATQSAAIGEQMEGLEGIVGSVGAKSSASLQNIASTVARLSSLTHGLSGGDLNKLTTDISDLGVMLNHPINVEQLISAGHALGVADDQLDAFTNRLFNVSRVTGVSMDEMTEQLRKNGYAFKSMGIDADVAVSILAQLDAAGIPTTGMMRAFAATTKEAHKDHVDFNAELLKQVKHIEDLDHAYGHAAAQDYAAKVFGPRGALSFMAAYDAGVISSKNLATAMNAPKQSIEDTFNATKNLGDQFHILKSVISESLAPLGIALSHSIGGGLQHISDWLKTHGDEVTGWFKNIVDAAIEAGESLVGAFSPFMQILGKIAVAYGNVFNDPAAKAAGLDLENAGKDILKPGGLVDGMEQARHKSDDFFNSLKQAVGIGQLIDDSLDSGGDKGLHIKDKSPHTQDDLNRLKGYGVTVGGDDNTLSIETHLKDPNKVKDEIKDLIKDGVKVSQGPDGDITLTADSKENRQRIVDFVRSQAGKNLKIPVEMDPHMGPLPAAPGAAPDRPGYHHTDGRPADGPRKDAQGHTILPGTGGSGNVIPPPSRWIPDILDLLRGHPGGGIPPGLHPPGRPDLTIAGGRTGGFIRGYADGGPIGDLLPGMLEVDRQNTYRTEQLLGALGLSTNEMHNQIRASYPSHTEVTNPYTSFRKHSIPEVLNQAFGGTIPGTGSGDHVPIMAEPGEWMMPGWMARGKYGAAMESVRVRGYQGGGFIGPNIPGIPAPPGGWSSPTEQHDEAWQEAQVAAQRATEHATDRVEDLQDSIEQYRTALDTAKQAMDDPANTPEELTAAQKAYAKTLRELNRATRDLGEAQDDAKTAARKQQETATKPPAGSDKSNTDAESMGKGLVKGVFQELGFPDVFGKAFTDRGLWKTLMAALQDFLPLLKKKKSDEGAVPGSHGETFAYPGLKHDAAVVLPPGAADALAQTYAPGGPQGPKVVIPPPAGSGTGGQGGQPGPGPITTPWGQDPHAATSGYTGGGGSQVQLASYITQRGQQLGLSPTEIGMALAVAKHEGTGPTGNPSMGFGPEAKAAGMNFDQNPQGAVDQYYQQYTSRKPAGLNVNDPSAIADYIWHTVHHASDPNYGSALLGAYGGAVSGGGFPSGVVPSAQSTGFTGAGLAGPPATDTASSGSPRYGGIPGAPSGLGQPIVSWLENQVQQYNAATGSNLSISADYPGGPHGHPDDGGDHSARRAVDVSGSQAQMDAFANYWANNPELRQATRQLIHQGPGFADASNVFGGQNRSGQGIYGADTMAGHGNHVHIAMQNLPGDINLMVPPGQPYGGSTPPGQSGSGQQKQQPQLVGYDTSNLTGDLGLPGDGYTYRHGDTGIFGMAGSMIEAYGGATGQKILHPFRGGSLGAATGATQQPDTPPPAPASAVTTSMHTRTPDLATVGAGRGGAHVTNISHHYEGITTPQKIAPAIMQTHMAATRATVPRTH
jgi:hypothetical protein